MLETRLQVDARRAYERGRLIAALKVGFVIAPIAAVCAWETGAVTRTVLLAAALLGLATTLRWGLHGGFGVVSSGLWSGAGPVAAALALCRFAPACPPDIAVGVCGLAGLLSGSVIGRGLANSPTRSANLLGAAVVASLLASLGCLALGIGSAVGATVGIALGSLASLALMRPSSA